MKGYAYEEVFTAEERKLQARAAKLVAKAPYLFGGSHVRCHELARAVAKVLGLKNAVCDGWFGMVEHTWLWTTPHQPLAFLPNVLDVYRPGCHPQVVLVHTSSTLPFDYRRGDKRKDIDPIVVDRLVAAMTRGNSS